MTARSASAAARSTTARRAARPATPARPLRVVKPTRTSRSVGALGTFVALALFATLLALAALHAALVQTQAGLDELVTENAARRERVDELLAEIAHLDSPAGVAEQARSAGLVAVPEIGSIAPIRPGALAPPGPDPFGLRAAVLRDLVAHEAEG